MKETLYFSVRELCYSDTAIKHGINNAPTKMEHIDNMLNLIFYFLNPLRVKLGKAVFINSGYRCPEVNEKVGGVSNSQHLIGQAADIRVNGCSAHTLWKYIKDSDLEYDQLILENGWVHVSYNPKRNRMQAFRI